MSRNPFASLDADSDVEEDGKLERVKASSEAGAAGSKAAVAKAVAHKKKEPAIPAPLPTSQEEIKQRQKKQEVVKKEVDKAARKAADAPQGRRGAGQSSGGAGAAGAAPRKREFDRHSGTGRGKEAPKGGAGAGNWGKTDGRQALADEKAAEQIEKSEAKQDKPSGEAAAPAAPVVEEPPVLTLDEYAALKKGKRTGKGFEQLKPRATVSTEVAGQVYRKSNDADETHVLIKMAAPATETPTQAAPAEKKEKKTVQRINLDLLPSKSRESAAPFRRGPPPSESSPRGERTGERTGAPRGAGRGGPRPTGAPRPSGPATESAPGPRINPNDETAFPKLGA